MGTLGATSDAMTTDQKAVLFEALRAALSVMTNALAVLERDAASCQKPKKQERTDEGERMVGYPELARRLGVSRSHAREMWVDLGMPVSKLGVRKCKRLRLSDVDAFVRRFADAAVPEQRM
jgi:hypothetical protein